MTAEAAATAIPPSFGRRVATAFHRRPRATLGALLAAPLGWLVLAYLGSLAIFFVAAIWSVDPFSGNLVYEATGKNFVELVADPIYATIAGRTVGMAGLVTLSTIVLAYPIAFYMAKVASPRVRRAMVVSIMLPLWSGYLVKVYAWRLILSSGGVLQWALSPIGLGTPGYTPTAVWLVETYLWLPYMIIPIYAGLERIPASLLEASADLGARAGHTFRRVVLPMTLPSVVAGSIFTFSLTLGDYITPTLVSNTRFIGNVINDFVGTSGNQPMAAAFALVPVAVMVLYLFAARKLGAFEAL